MAWFPLRWYQAIFCGLVSIVVLRGNGDIFGQGKDALLKWRLGRPFALAFPFLHVKSTFDSFWITFMVYFISEGKNDEQTGKGFVRHMKDQV